MRRGAARQATLVAMPAALLVGVLVFWLMGGFPAGPQSTAQVQMPTRTLSARAEVVCRALLSQLPDTLRDRPRRSVTAGQEQNAAFGDPAITLACGGPAASITAGSEVWSISHICWYAEERATSTVWTTVDREIPVSVTIPAAYEGAGDWVNEFSAPLTATVPSSPTAPTGCT